MISLINSKRKIILNFCIIFCLFVAYIYIQFSKEHQKEFFFRSNSNDSICENEWLALSNNQVIFKKDASFFFYKLSIINLNFISRREIQFNFRFNLNIQFKIKNLHYNFNHTLPPPSINRVMNDLVDNTWDYNTLDLFFDLDEFFILQEKNVNLDKNKVKLTVDIIDNLTVGRIILKFIIPKIESKKSAAICSKAIIPENNKEYSNLKWWILVNELSADYEKIVFFS